MLPKTKPIFVATCYRPPNQSTFSDRFEENLFNLRSDSETIILGDFNICLFKKASSLYKAYANILRIFNLDQIITEPTRVSNTSSTLIDHILCNNKDRIFQSGTIPIGVSDHFITFCSRKVPKGYFNSHKTVKIRSMKNHTKQEFIQNLTNSDWSSCFNSSCVNDAWSSFHNIFMTVLNNIAPIKEVRLKQRTEPWMTSEILELIKARESALYNFKKHKSNDYYKQFCKYRNKVQYLIKSTKASYFSDKVEEHKFDAKGLWQQLKKLGYKSKSNKLMENCKQYTSPLPVGTFVVIVTKFIGL